MHFSRRGSKHLRPKFAAAVMLLAHWFAEPIGGAAQIKSLRATPPGPEVRLGDWVEINGVTGEVVELGMFHTVLLETGNWTDSGHPTGRRVTFTNSFAIEGHYFNFSTSGQWLWDELTLVLASSQNPYPIVEAIQKTVLEATAESAGQAEKEWQHAAHSRNMRALSAAPAINLKPVSAGIEIAVRYITRANERYELRSRLYQAAMNLISKKEAHEPVSISEKQGSQPA